VRTRGGRAVLPSHMDCRHLPAGRDRARNRPALKACTVQDLWASGGKGGILRKGVVRIRAKTVMRHAQPGGQSPARRRLSPGRPGPGPTQRSTRGKTKMSKLKGIYRPVRTPRAFPQTVAHAFVKARPPNFRACLTDRHPNPIGNCSVQRTLTNGRARHHGLTWWSQGHAENEG